MKDKPKKILITFLQAEFNRLVEFQHRNGFMSFSEMVRQLIRIGEKQIEPPYVKLQKDKPRTPEEKAHARVEKRVIEKQLEDENIKAEGLSICEALGGDVIDKGDGRLMCEYRLYELIGDRVDESFITESLSMLDPETPLRQFKDASGNTGPEIKEKIMNIINANEKDNNMQPSES